MEELMKSRKFWFMSGVTVVVLGCGVALVLTGNLEAAVWVDLAKWIGGIAMGAFGIGNGLEHIGNGKK